MRLGRIQNDFSAAGFDLVKAQGLEFIEFCCNNDEQSHRLIDAKESIKKEIVEVSSLLTEKMLQREVSMDDHKQFIDSFIESIGDEDDADR